MRKKRLSKIGIWWHNIKQEIVLVPEPKLIRCDNCDKLQEKANWDYQKCNECKEYLYDIRQIL